MVPLHPFALPTGLFECGFTQPQKSTDMQVDSQLLLHLATQRIRRGFVELHMAARKKLVAMLLVLTDQNSAVVNQNASGDDFDGSVEHGYGRYQLSSRQAKLSMFHAGQSNVRR